MADNITVVLSNLKDVNVSLTSESSIAVTLSLLDLVIAYVLFVPTNYDSILTSDGNTFKVREV